MEFRNIKNLMGSEDWYNALLSTIKLKSTIERDKASLKNYHVLLSEIVDKICLDQESLNDFLVALKQAPNDNNEGYRKLLNTFLQRHKFNAVFGVISGAINHFPRAQFFYKHRIDLHIKLDERQKAHEAANLFVNNFPRQSYGYLKFIQTLLTLKRKKEALTYLKTHKNKLSNVHILEIYERLNHYESAMQLCSKILSKNKNAPYWHAKKLLATIKLARSREEIVRSLNLFIRLKPLQPENFKHLIPAARLHPHVHRRLINLYADNSNGLQAVNQISNYISLTKAFNKYVNQPITNLTIPANKNVDLVYTWVDMSDENFLKKFKEATGAYPDKSDNFQQNQTRYTNNNEIMFSLKTVQAFFKEVNHIYIVTNDQEFDLDFLEPDFQEKISFVFQKNIMPDNFVQQTVFDSNLIEAFLWNIEGLAETFMYCCDDYFFGAELKLTPHFFSKEGVPHAIVAPANNLNLKFHSALSQYAGDETKFQTFRYNAARHFLNHSDEIPPFKELHVPVILSRKACIEAFKIFAPDWQDSFFKNSLRSNDSVYALQVYLWYALKKGYQIPGPHQLFNRRSLVFAHGLDEHNCELIKKVRPIFGCVNYLLDDESKIQFKHLSENYIKFQKQNIEYSKLKVVFTEKRYLETIHLSEKFINLENCPFWILKINVRSHLNLNNIESAITLSERAKGLKPKDIGLLNMMVNLYMKNRNWEAASIILKDEIQVQNFTHDSYRRLVLCYTILEATDQLVDLAISMPDEHKHRVNFLIAKSLLKLKKYELANHIKERDFATDINLSSSIEIVRLYELEQFEQAKMEIEKLLERPEFRRVNNVSISAHIIYNIHCEILIEEQNWELGEQQCKCYMKLFPNALIFRRHLLKIFDASNNTESYAELIKDTYLKFGTRHFWVIFRYTRHLQLTGQEELAIQILQKEVLTNSKAFSILLNIYLGKGDFESFMELAKLPNFDSANKIELLEGTISTYLNMGYYKTIPTLFKNLINTEAIEIKLFAIKILAVNLGNRFYSIINSRLINTNLILSKDEKSTVQNQLNDLNHDFNPRSLTYSLIDQAAPNQNDTVEYFISLAKTYLQKLEVRNNVWLNTYEDPDHAFEVVKILKDRIKNKIPTSFIRLGDGEGNYLKYAFHLLKEQPSDQEDIQAIWWKDSIVTDPKINKEFANHLGKAVANADLIGVFPDRRLFRIFKLILAQGKLLRAHRGGTAVMNAVLNLEGDKQILTSCHAHFDLENWDLYNYLFQDLNAINLISCHRALPPYLTERFGIEDIKLWDIPSEQMFTKLFGYNEKAKHYPERYKEILEHIKTISKGEVFLVAAGFLGKIYCDKIKEAGGIGIDIGSIADYWMSFKTRSNDKIPPVRNGIRFKHEIGSKLELPSAGKKTKTNHYCNKQLDYEENYMESHDVKFLIAGHPRSGTGFVSKLFKEFGFKVGHERVEEAGISSWLHAVSNLNTPFFGYRNIGKYNISRYHLKIENILLLIRHPKDIIPSIILENSVLLSYNYRRYHIFEATGVDLDNYASSLEKAIASYLEWIRIIELQEVVAVIRLEKAKEDITQFFQEKKLTFNSEINEDNILSRNSTKEKFGIQKPKISPTEYKQVDKELLARLMLFCEQYGYDSDFLQNS